MRANMSTGTGEGIDVTRVSKLNTLAARPYELYIHLYTKWSLIVSSWQGRIKPNIILWGMSADEPQVEAMMRRLWQCLTPYIFLRFPNMFPTFPDHVDQPGDFGVPVGPLCPSCVSTSTALAFPTSSSLSTRMTMHCLSGCPGSFSIFPARFLVSPQWDFGIWRGLSATAACSGALSSHNYFWDLQGNWWEFQGNFHGLQWETI